MKAHQLVIDLNRPEYVPYTEHFISDLCWSNRDVSGWRNSDVSEPGKTLLGLIYDAEGGSPNKVQLIATKPSGDSGRWNSALRSSGLLVTNNEISVGHAVADALFGVKATKARRHSVAPVTPNTALLQNKYGVFLKAGPPNIASILEVMHHLGRPSTDDGRSAEPQLLAESLQQVLKRRISNDPFLAIIDQAVLRGVMPEDTSVSTIEPDTGYLKDLPVEFAEKTPYSWLYENWQRLSSEEWIDALSARRWVDWACTVLRTAFAFGFLWEMRWYDTLARSILQSSINDQRVSIKSVMQITTESGTLKWVDAGRKITERDIAQPTRNLIARGVAVRSILKDATIGNEQDAEEFLLDASRARELCADLEEALNPKFGSPANNLWEAIKYTLRPRVSENQHSDHYGLLQSFGSRFTVIEPATEWIAVIASLACVHPGVKSNLGNVQQSLFHLGLQPNNQTLIHYLEQAGLSRSTPDADLGLFVEPAF